jgi:DNA-binding MltR family transcriptional regulator
VSQKKPPRKEASHDREVAIFLDEFTKESDRGAALVAASQLDELLRAILKAFFVESKISTELLDSFNAPIGSFSSRIAVAYALGLIQKDEFDEITLIRKIRNEFSHKWKGATFNSSPIRDFCNSLQLLGSFGAKEAPRARFYVAVMILFSDLLSRDQLVSKERRTAGIWPNRARDKARGK